MTTFQKDWEAARPKTIAFAKSAAITVRRIPLDDLFFRAINEYNEYNAEAISEGYVTPLHWDETDTHMTKRIRNHAVRQVRHGLTNYDELWKTIIGVPGEREAWASIAVRTSEAIAEAYPELRPETERYIRKVLERHAEQVEELQQATKGLTPEEALTVAVAADSRVDFTVDNYRSLKVETVEYHNRTLPLNDENRLTLSNDHREDINRLKNAMVEFLQHHRSTYFAVLHRFLNEPGEAAAWDLIHRQFHRRATGYLPILAPAFDYAMSEPFGLDYKHYRIPVPVQPANHYVLIRKLPLALATEHALAQYNSTDMVLTETFPSLSAAGGTLYERLTRDRVVAVHILSTLTNIHEILKEIIHRPELTGDEANRAATVALQDTLNALKKAYPTLAEAFDAEKTVLASLVPPSSTDKGATTSGTRPGHSKIQNILSPQGWPIVVDDVPLKDHHKSLDAASQRVGSTKLSRDDFQLRLARHIILNGTNQSALASALARMPKHLRAETSRFVWGRLFTAASAAYPSLETGFQMEYARKMGLGRTSATHKVAPPLLSNPTGVSEKPRITVTPKAVPIRKPMTAPAPFEAPLIVTGPSVPESPLGLTFLCIPYTRLMDQVTKEDNMTRPRGARRNYSSEGPADQLELQYEAVKYLKVKDTNLPALLSRVHQLPEEEHEMAVALVNQEAVRLLTAMYPALTEVIQAEFRSAAIAA